MPHHQDDNKACDFHMLLHLYGLSFLAGDIGRQDYI